MRVRSAVLIAFVIVACTRDTALVTGPHAVASQQILITTDSSRSAATPEEDAIADSIVRRYPFGVSSNLTNALADRPGRTAIIRLRDSAAQRMVDHLTTLRAARHLTTAGFPLVAATPPSSVPLLLATISRLPVQRAAQALLIRSSDPNISDVLLLPDSALTASNLIAAIAAVRSIRRSYGDVSPTSSRFGLRWTVLTQAISPRAQALAQAPLVRLHNAAAANLPGVGVVPITQVWLLPTH